MDPPEQGGPEEPGPPEQDNRPADQERPKTEPARKGGRHRRVRHRRRLTAAQVAELVKCAPGTIRIADEVGKHEAPIRELIHTLTGAAQQVADAVHTLFS
jgi:hypothetical protein